MSFTDIVSKFNRQADSHSKSQSLNPFSDQFEQSRSPSPRFSREEYGKPVAGSKTDLRGRKAKTHICREILELCTVIHDVGTYNTKKRVPDEDDDDDQQMDDGTIIVSFGELFQIYTKISDKVVGLLIAAKRRGFVYFDREILFQRRDDDVLIALLKPVSEISKILKDDINQANSLTTPVESKPVEKKKSPSSSKTKRVKPATTVDQPQVSSEVANVNTTIPPAVEVGMADDRKTNGEAIDAKNVVDKDVDRRHENCNGNNNIVIDVGEELLVSNVVEISENMDDQCVRAEDNNTVSVEEEHDNTVSVEEEHNNVIEVVAVRAEEERAEDEGSIAVIGETAGATDGSDVVVVVENKIEIGDDLAADDNRGGEVRAEVENVRSETARVEINKTQMDGGQVEDVTEESANVVEKNDNNNVAVENGTERDSD